MVAYYRDIFFSLHLKMKRFLATVSISLLFAACSTVPQSESSPEDATPQEVNMADMMGISVEELRNQTPEEHMEMMQKMMMKADDAMENEDMGMDMMEEDVMATRVIEITAEDWAFAPATITVKKGEKVQLSITGVTGDHGYAVPDLGINVGVIAGETVVVDLPTDKAGEFAVRCSVPCGSGHKDMTGMIIIEE